MARHETTWAEFRDGDDTARSALLDEHLGLVHYVARNIWDRVPDLVELDDLVSAGTLGLMAAMESFDADRGLAFSTYAMPRVRGAILDELRSMDWVPRSVRSRARKVRRTEEALETRYGRHASRAEVASVLGIDVETLGRWKDDADNATQIALDEPLGNDGDAVCLEDMVPDGAVQSPDAWIATTDAIDTLRQVVVELPERERTILALYYFEELNLRQIAEVLGLTESRISQVRTRALNLLRNHMQAVYAGGHVA